MIVKLQDHKGKTHEMFLPLLLQDLTFMQLVEFLNRDEKYLKEVTGENEEPIALLLDTTKVICGPIVEELPAVLPGDEDLYDKKYLLKPQDEVSMMRLYCHIHTVINTYNPEQKIGDVYKMEFKGEEYFLSGKRAVMLFTGGEGMRLTTGEAIEVSEWRRRFVKEAEKRGDPTGELQFRMGLAEMAILLRKDGEKLPHRVTELESFMTKRMQHFAGTPPEHKDGINATVAMDVRFFLLATLKSFISNPDIKFFGKDGIRSFRQINGSERPG